MQKSSTKAIRMCVYAASWRRHKPRTRTLPPPSNWCGTPPTPKHSTNGLRGRDSDFWVWGGAIWELPVLRVTINWRSAIVALMYLSRVQFHATEESQSCRNASIPKIRQCAQRCGPFTAAVGQVRQEKQLGVPRVEHGSTDRGMSFI